MEGKLVGGIIAFIIGVLFLILYVSSKITILIKLKKLNFNKTIGKVIKSVNTSDIKYKERKNEEFFDKHEGSREIYSFLKGIFPTDYRDDHSGPTYASVIQYRVNEHDYEITSSFSSDKKEKKGKVYQIGYKPTDPRDAFIMNDRGGIIWIILIIVLLGAGTYLIWF